MVVTSLPATARTGNVQVRTAAPSTCIVHAPHRAAPQPNFVPFSLKVSRTTQSSGVSGSSSTRTVLPFSVNSIMKAFSSGLRPFDRTETARRSLTCTTTGHPTLNANRRAPHRRRHGPWRHRDSSVRSPAPPPPRCAPAPRATRPPQARDAFGSGPAARASPRCALSMHVRRSRCWTAPPRVPPVPP